MKTPKIAFKLVRSFSIGFTIYSPKLNGFACDICFACFTLSLWSRGSDGVMFQNFWK